MQQQYGVERGVMVAMLLNRDANMVIAILAIMMAHGAYVPLEPAFPKKRILLILDNSSSACVVTMQEHLHLTGHHAALCLDRQQCPSSQTSSSLRANPESLVYVAYTSGTTVRAITKLACYADTI